MRAKTTRRRLLPGGALALTALLLAGCSNGGRDYAVPKDLCGVPVPEKALAPLLPDGKEIQVSNKEFTLAQAWITCGVSVDDEYALSAMVIHEDEFHDPMKNDEGFKVTDKRALKLPFKGAGAIGDLRTKVAVPCGTAEAPNLIAHLTVYEDTAEKDEEKRRAALRDATLAFVPELKKKLGCTA
ncbi:hypothetical protein ACH41E_16060 [Streptomyces sp. NPDC020412]|uniref:hypothetical protein n=1 Tax=Streptomyces sp. NPDC020412 TaxID=3365073 RepID=UPI0037957450